MKMRTGIAFLFSYFLIGLPVTAEPIKLSTEFKAAQTFDLWVYDQGWNVGWGWVTVYGPDRKLKYRFWKQPTPEQASGVEPPPITFAFTPEEMAATGGAKPLPTKVVEYESYTLFEQGKIGAKDVKQEILQSTSSSPQPKTSSE